MIASDKGFFVLATHSFIEKYLNENYPDFNANHLSASFNDNLHGYKRYLIDTFHKPISSNKTFKRISDQRTITNKVRHEFGDTGLEQVQIATYNFIEFCQIVGLESENLNELSEHLDDWKDKRSHVELSQELLDTKFKLHMSNRKRKQLTADLEKYDSLNKENDHYSTRILALDMELEFLKSQTEQRKEKIDDLRKERNDWKLKQKEAQNRLNDLEDVKEYYLNLLKMTLLTTTRLDYERSLVQLTPEQKDVLDSINLNNDFLIKGGAGTGKTLVLLEALKQINRDILGLDKKEILLITYTRTLVKYDRYLSHIMSLEKSDISIETSDRILNNLFNQLGHYRMDYTKPFYHLDDFSHSKLNKNELKREIEEYIYGQGITREEYIENMIARRGLKIRLTQKEREELWEIKEEWENIMLDEGVVSKGLSRKLLLESCPVPQTDYIFIDESQDLSVVELRIYKQLARISLIMAGDGDQTIYGIQSPYARAGLALSGRTKILKHNYRNTLPIHRLAEKLRLGIKNSEAEKPDREIAPNAFREGPHPELYLGERSEDLYEQMINKIRAYITLLNYDKENICILVPENKMIDRTAERLTGAGWESANISDKNFSFDETPGIRLSTIHACKGLDLPVTMLFLPRLTINTSGLSEETARKQSRNLLYVALTRAMEHLNVFMKEEPGNPLLEELKELMEE